jgi:hypothetical protein
VDFGMELHFPSRSSWRHPMAMREIDWRHRRSPRRFAMQLWIFAVGTHVAEPPDSGRRGRLDDRAATWSVRVRLPGRRYREK